MRTIQRRVEKLERMTARGDEACIRVLVMPAGLGQISGDQLDKIFDARETRTGPVQIVEWGFPSDENDASSRDPSVGVARALAAVKAIP